MEESKFTYCEGQNCIKKESCSRYIEGKSVGTKTEGFWWQSSCDDRIPPVKEFVRNLGPLSKIAYYLGVIKITPKERVSTTYASAQRSVRWWNPLTFVVFLLYLIPVLVIIVLIVTTIVLALIGDEQFFSTITFNTTKDKSVTSEEV